ncbi:MAG TPA: glycosyltransferase family 2 protein [Steroidobacteraceae bacterium]
MANPVIESPRGLDVAVVIVTYRTADLTVAALHSLASERTQRELRIRAVVVDNASGDLPAIEAAVAEQEWSSWVTPVGSSRNGGFAYGNNFGIQRAYETAAPDYIYLLNPDAEVRPGALIALTRFLESNPEAGIAGSSFEDPDGSEWPIAFRFPTLLSELCQGLELGLVSRLLQRWVLPRTMSAQTQPVDWICGASMMIRPAVFSAIGGLDENYFLYFEETDFCLRAKRAGFSTWYVPASRVMHIRGQSTKVTDRVAEARRLPAYWFESRRRYFALTFGIRQAMAIDIVALVASCLGFLKRVALRRQHSVKHFIRDLARHSVLWRGNRVIPKPRSLLRPNVTPR